MDYTWMVIDYQQFIERFNSNFKACNRLHKSCNQLPEGIFRKYFPRVTCIQMVYEWPSKVTWKHEFK